MSRPRRLRSGFVLGAAAISATMLAAASCSLDLDESKIGEGAETGVPDTNVDETATGDSGDGGGPIVTPDASTCTKDEECVTTNGCLKGRCDQVRKACVFDVCRTMACNAGVCDTAAKTCGAPKAYKFLAGQFSVGTQASRIVAVYPYLFAQTATGILAFDVSNPAATAPRQVPIVGLGFVPNQTVATGNRVYFSAPVTGPGPSRLPLAWIDVPSDPFATKLEVTSVLATYSRAEAPSLLGHTEDKLYLLGPPGANYPSAIVDAPLVEPLTITATPLAITMSTSPAALSGNRLVMIGFDTSNIPSFGLINGAGTTMPMNTGDTKFADAGNMASSGLFAWSPEGAVFWSVPTLTGPPSPPAATAPNLRSVMARFLLPDGNGGFDLSAGFDVETYNIALGPNLIGPTAMIDANTAIVLAADKTNVVAQTTVQFAKRMPLGLVKNMDNTTPRRQTIALPIGAFTSATGSNGFGYVAANETGPPPNSTIYVFDPGCAP